MTIHPVLASPRKPHRRTVAACLATALWLAACGGGGDGAPAPSPEPEGRSGALAAAKPGELAAWAQGQLRTLDAQGRLATNGRGLTGDLPPTTSPISGAAPGATGGDSTSRTLVQEEGVDEADLLRTDGRVLHALVRDGSGGLALVAQTRGADGSLSAPVRLELERDDATLDPEGLLPSSDGSALAVVARRWQRAPGEAVCDGCFTIAPIWFKSGVFVQRVDTSDAARPRAGTRLAIDGQLVDTRRIGDTLVVVAVHRPVLQAQSLPATASAAERVAAIARVGDDQLIPRISRNGGAPEPLLRDTDCWLQRDNGSLSLQLTTVTLIDLKSPGLTQSSRCFAGGTEAVYLTPQNLWLATTRFTPLGEGASPGLAPPPSTDVHQFALDLSGTGGLAWRGSAVVQGHLGWDMPRKSYRFSEHAGHLRVITFTGDQGWASEGDTAKAPSPARLTVLRTDSAAASSDGRTLATVATLPNSQRPAAIGKPGEQIFAVRFAGTRGYVVTFRRIDPLYVLDLSNPADPRMAGEVELPGFSQALFPLEGGLLLGLGRDADSRGVAQGIQVTLFDVADAAAPRVLAIEVLGSAGSMTALEHSRHGLALRTDGNRVRGALPVVLTGAPWRDWKRGLQTFEVDTATRTLVMKPLKAVQEGVTFASNPGDERAVLIGEQAIHLRDGALTAHGW